MAVHHGLILALIMISGVAARFNYNMNSVKIEAITSSTTVGEGPHWDHDAQLLYFVDIFDCQVRRYDPATKKETKVVIPGGQPVTLVVPIKGQRNKFVISQGRNLLILEWDGVSDKPTSLRPLVTVDDVEGKRTNRLNDGKADPSGRLWAGTMGAKLGPGKFVMNNGALYSISRNGTAVPHVDGISCSNGLVWSLDKKLMYYTDTFTWNVEVFDFDIAKGEVSNRRLFYNYTSNKIAGHPDGMTIDTKGRLYLPCFGGAQVLVVNPSGTLERVIPVPAYRVTSVAFGGKNLDELFITTATEDTTEEEWKKYPLSGRTFRVTGLGAKGLPGQAVILDENLYN